MRSYAATRGWDPDKFSAAPNNDASYSLPAPLVCDRYLVFSSQPKTSEMRQWLDNQLIQMPRQFVAQTTSSMPGARTMFHTPLPSQTPTAQRFSAGDIVEIHGLVRKPELNGSRATVIQYNPDTQRYGIQLQDDSRVLVKGENLVDRSIRMSP